jgi:SAM-dependent methyltransferase
MIDRVSDEARLRSEQQFFDEKSLDSRPPLNGFYERSQIRLDYASRLFEGCQGKSFLEYGCGTGSYAFELADRGAQVTGIDISEGAIQVARSKGYPENNPRFLLGNAEALEFDDASFDVVCGTSILHHLQLDVAARELRRVLRPGGRAIFYEPVAYNPLVNLYRLLTPNLHTPDEHPLKRGDLDLLSRSFSASDHRFGDLVSLGAIPFLGLPGGKQLLRLGELVDRALLRIAGLRWMGAVVLIELRT